MFLTLVLLILGRACILKITQLRQIAVGQHYKLELKLFQGHRLVLLVALIQTQVHRGNTLIGHGMTSQRATPLEQPVVLPKQF